MNKFNKGDAIQITNRHIMRPIEGDQGIVREIIIGGTSYDGIIYYNYIVDIDGECFQVFEEDMIRIPIPTITILTEIIDE